MTNEEAILKGLREIYKQNKEILSYLNKEANNVASFFKEKPKEGNAARLMREGIEKSKN